LRSAFDLPRGARPFVGQAAFLNEILNEPRKRKGAEHQTFYERTMPTLTLCQAAKATGRTKATIQEAIKKGRISARKNDLGRYEIDPAELHRVYPIPAPEQTAPTAVEVAEFKGRIETLQAVIRGLEQTLAQVEGERDRQSATVARLTAALPAPAVAHTAPAAEVGAPDVIHAPSPAPEPAAVEIAQEPAAQEIEPQPAPNRGSIRQLFAELLGIKTDRTQRAA
jgi:hypothetical protein